jgi:hypothetical protein
MGYCKWIDSLPKIVKILLAIFLDILFVIYRIIFDVVNGKTNMLLWDILLGIVPIPVVFWVMDIIYIITKNQVFSFEEWFGGAKA